MMTFIVIGIFKLIWGVSRVSTEAIIGEYYINEAFHTVVPPHNDICLF
jgi:hypothetical protein